MSDVCVITGGGSGMGLAAAKFLPKEKRIVVSGRTESKLQKAAAELQELGYTAYAKTCDTSNRESVRALAAYAASLGRVTNVIHAAGVSPGMAQAEAIVRINALGTVYVNQEFAAVMQAGSVIVDVSSNSAYALPGFLTSERIYRLADTNEALFVKKLLRLPGVMKDGYRRSGLTYALSKNFAVWYAQKSAFEYGKRGIRVVSISPGLVSTDMGNLEAEEGGSMLAFACEQRMGKPEELGYAIATLADERNGYLAGVDVLCDGGSTNGKRFRKSVRN
ncbi:MAG: SDR family NAD(P)-dependent oxidoreductase [Clostridiales bacterium]|nr:SDR family NAD(P)-dependent oxidoreductase [Clostridiales bacterium]